MAWNGSNQTGRATSMTSPQKKNHPVASLRRPYQRGILAGFLVVALGGASVWWFVGRGLSPSVPQTVQKKSQGTIAEVSPVMTTNRMVTTESTKTSRHPKRMYMGSEVVRVETSTNAGVLVERLYTADGKRHRITHVPPSIFKHATDEYLGTILSTPPNCPMPPLPDLSREGNIVPQGDPRRAADAFAHELSVLIKSENQNPAKSSVLSKSEKQSPIHFSVLGKSEKPSLMIITENDPREVRELKQIVNGLREEMAAYLANGNGTPRSYWRRLIQRTQQEAQIYERTRRELEHETNPAVFEQKNHALRNLGLRTIPNPKDGE